LIGIDTVDATGVTASGYCGTPRIQQRTDLQL